MAAAFSCRLLWIFREKVDTMVFSAKKSKIPKRITAMLAAMFCMLSLFGCNNTAQNEETTQAEEESLSFTNSVNFVASVGSYSAKKQAKQISGVIASETLKILSVGSDNGILSAAARNISGEDIEYGILQVKVGSEYLSFTFSGLPAGADIVLFEDNDTAYDESEAYTDWRVDSLIYYDTQLQLYPEIVEIIGGEGYVNIKNLTESDISNLQIYYKTVKDGVYYGGTTYRVTVDTLETGTTLEKTAVHFTSDSEVIFVTYGN